MRAGVRTWWGRTPPYVLALMLLATPVLAVQPDEILADTGLEARAREISRQIRCPVCQGESIDDSSAPISRDLRVIIRERLMAGDSDEAVIDYVVDRYGEFVLFNPRATGSGLVLWLAGPAMLIVGVAVAAVAYRRRKTVVERELTTEERAKLNDLLKG
jgi:cytochrome c-type biogenesis protein CcmH